MKTHPFKHLQLAISFYTRLPIVTNTLDYTQLPQAAIYLPIVGWLVGGGAALTFYMAATGGLHEDGFADVCDGFGGGYDKARILAIMKDSHVGVYAVLGLLLLLALKISVLSNMPVTAVPWVLLAGHSVSRFAPLLLMHRYDYARAEDSKASGAVYTPRMKELLVAAGCACLPLLLLPSLCLLAVIPVLMVNAGLGHYFYRHIGGYTGDCLGASQQIAEIIFYLTVSSLWIFI
ncbi:MAG: Cobalamin synthase [Methylococcaceae bacterium NSP1-2]|nr:adenosylcobinamide-GDP ribazoletransferase [Methylococcaceae bacterium]OYV15185.1 MAG: Cobalamin synthase [Methylococcaceae bacterium NSP1-2]